MRKVKISHAKFTSIFKNRTSTFRDRVSRTIYFVEDNGEFSVEEKASFTAKVGLLILIIPFSFLVLVWAGVRELPNFWVRCTELQY